MMSLIKKTMGKKEFSLKRNSRQALHQLTMASSHVPCIFNEKNSRVFKPNFRSAVEDCLTVKK